MAHRKFKKPRFTNFRKRRRRYVTKPNPKRGRISMRGLTSPSANTVMPRTKTIRLTYYHTRDMAAQPTADVPASHTYRANGIFDPDYTGVGHQPRGFDQWASHYKKYRVISSKVTVLTNSTSSGTLMGIWTGNIADVPNIQLPPISGTRTDDFWERGDIRKSIMGSQTAGAPYKYLSAAWSNKSYKQGVTTDMKSATVTNDPADNQVFRIYKTGVTSTVLSPATSLVIRIVYQVQFFDPVPFGAS